MSLFLEEGEKKALVRLKLKEDELGFATKIYVPQKKVVLLITSASIFPDDVDTTDIVVHRCVARSWWSRKFKQENPAIVKNIENHKQADVSTVVFEGDEKNPLPYEVLTDDKKKNHEKLSACVFEDKKLIQLQFENQGGSYKLIKVSKEGFDVKKAKGAPVIIAERTGTLLGLPISARKIVGVLSINSNGDLYPVLFKDGFLGEDVQTKKPRTASDNRERDHAEDSEKLKKAIKGNTEYQTKFMAAHDVTSAKTDDIFTNLTVYYADEKQVKKEQEKGLSRSEHLQEYTKRTEGFKVQTYEDIFIDMKRENPKLLLTGKPGIGKTFFCEKIIRDWSMNRLFQNEDTPNIKFAYLLKFRQLSSHGNKVKNLHELLNCSPLLDDNSVIDDSLFEYLTKNPSEVLIILDGFDEYSEQHRKQIASDFEQQYPNDSRAKMPIPALCSKLIRGKVFKNSVVLVSSRPGEAEKLGEINVDRYVEISGFSPEQVTEYVDNYFSQPEKEQKAKNTVREHVEKNENLVSFCHIPLLSFLLCWCLEWRITESGMTEDLPAKITDLYDEVVNVVVQKLHAHLKYSEMSGNTMKVAQETLDKLAELAASLLKKSKYIFDEADMKRLYLTKNEIENLKKSGILHCVPGIRISAFRTKAEYSFNHLTLQEYLSASFFVKNKEIPDRKQVSGQTLVFMSGCLRGKDGELMENLIQQITPEDGKDHVNKLLMLQCLYEYGEDKLTELTINNLYDKYCYSDGWISCDGVTDVDMKYMSYLLDVIHLLKEQHPQPSSGYILDIINSPLTSFGVGILCDSLVRNSFINGLVLYGCSLDDKCVEKITDSLVNTEITYLDLEGNKITDEGAESIRRVIIQDNCHVELLYLLRNQKITAECKKRVKQLVQKHKPGVTLYI